jgi:hypothetical protein
MQYFESTLTAVKPLDIKFLRLLTLRNMNSLSYSWEITDYVDL